MRNKISNNLKQRVDAFRRMSTKKMMKQKSEESKDPFDAAIAMSTVQETQADDDDMTELDRRLADIPEDDMSEALNNAYDVIDNKSDTSPYR